MTRIPTAELSNSDLLVDAVYEGTRRGNAGDDPLPSLVGTSNQGGFRYLGNVAGPRLIVITSSFNDPDWPDHLDRETGLLTYYGDNKKPGKPLHDTPRFGNRLLQQMFDLLHTGGKRDQIPPILVFGNAGTYRDMVFLGLAVPGAQGQSATEDLAAVWKVLDDRRFQNYRALFTILDAASISRAWLNDIKAGNHLSNHCPKAWRRWVEFGAYEPLQTSRAIQHRTKAQQLPTGDDAWAMLKSLTTYFSDSPTSFEACAAKLAQMMDSNFAWFDITRTTRDGGRDAIGQYRIGYGDSSIIVECALEAKCYAASNSVGVREVSRLISRLRHRQFGILVTTSYLEAQAYRELKDDLHPVIVMAGADAVDVLARSGVRGAPAVSDWLHANFPY